MSAKVRILGCAVFGAVVLVACAGANQANQNGEGVTNLQAPNTCLDRGASCTASSDCCTLWCANWKCATREP